MALSELCSENVEIPLQIYYHHCHPINITDNYVNVPIYMCVYT